MTHVELAVIHLTKKQYKTVDDFVKLIVLADYANRKKFTLKADFLAKSNLKNVGTFFNRNKIIKNLIIESYNKFSALDKLQPFAKYVIWWTYTVFDNKMLKKYSSIDLINDVLLKQYIEWSTVFLNNIDIYNRFIDSCKYVLDICVQSNRDVESVLEYLVLSDKLSVSFTTGGVSEYALATIPKTFLNRISFNSKNIFTQQLFQSIWKNEHFLTNKINNVCKYMIATPVNFINQVEYFLIKRPPRRV